MNVVRLMPCLYSLCVRVHISDINSPLVAEHNLTSIPGCMYTEVQFFLSPVWDVALYQERVELPHSSAYLDLSAPVSVDPFSHALPAGVYLNQSELTAPLNQLIRLDNETVCEQPWICLRQLFPFFRVLFVEIIQ